MKKNILFLALAFIFVCKVHSQPATIIFAKNFGGCCDDKLAGIVITSSGEIFIGGYGNSNDHDFGNAYGAFDEWLIRMNTANTG